MKSLSCWAAGLVLVFAGIAFAGPPDPAPGEDAVPFGSVEQQFSDLVHFNKALEPKEGQRGRTLRLTITGKLKDGYHTDPVTQRSEDPVQTASSLTSLEFKEPPGIKVLWPISESTPKWDVDKAGGVFLKFFDNFTWSMDILVLPEVKPGDRVLTVDVRLLVCNERGCTPGSQTIDVPIHVGNAPAEPLTTALKERLNAPMPRAKIVRVPADLRPKMSNAGEPEGGESPTAPTGRDGNSSSTTTQDASTPSAEIDVAEVGFFKYLLFAMGAGFIMLFTPCVFPMIPVTVSFFLKQGEKEHNSPLILACVYSGTIILCLTLAVLVLGGAIQAYANNEWLNLAMGLVLVVFALSLFGMYELELPSFLIRFTSSHQGTGYVGAVFMALTFTINSFTCTGPFLGPLLTSVKELKMGYFQLVSSALAYSFAFAAPFFILALFPRLLKSLPRSGGWLNAVKVVMGFVELALAAKFFGITDANLFPGNPQLFNYDTVLCTWIALSVACGLYLFGIFRLPHDTPLEHVGVPRLLMATLCLGMAVYMTPLMWRKPPLGKVGGLIVAWLPQDSAPFGKGTADGGEPRSSELSWSRDYEKAWTEARQAHKLLFIDFTGVNCQNCRWNELNVFPRPDVRAEMARFVRVQLYTDRVPDPALSATQSRELADQYRSWQAKTFTDVSLPLYAVVDPTSEKAPFTDDGKLAGKIRGKASGSINDVAAFVGMLKKAGNNELALAGE